MWGAVGKGGERIEGGTSGLVLGMTMVRTIWIKVQIGRKTEYGRYTVPDYSEFNNRLGAHLHMQRPHARPCVVLDPVRRLRHRGPRS